MAGVSLPLPPPPPPGCGVGVGAGVGLVMMILCGAVIVPVTGSVAETVTTPSPGGMNFTVVPWAKTGVPPPYWKATVPSMSRVTVIGSPAPAWVTLSTLIAAAGAAAQTRRARRTAQMPTVRCI